MTRTLTTLLLCTLLAACYDDPTPYSLPPGQPDTCQAAPNAPDSDQDGLPDRCDLCPNTKDPSNLDSDSDLIGDACDPDLDGDGIPNEIDSCPTLAVSPSPPDSDGDGIPNPCDPCHDDDADSDQDGIPNCKDLCPNTKDPDQNDQDNDGVGDLCDSCPNQPNASGQTVCQPSETFSWEEATIAQIHNAITSKQHTCLEITQGFLRRIRAHDLDTTTRPPINSIVLLNQNALTRAFELDQAFALDKKLQGSMHCIPVLLKDIYGNTEIPISSGSLALQNTTLKKDAFLVQRMKAQGAIMLATTTMDEFSQGIDGISSRSGRSGNPYDTTRSPGGSSSGSGAAIGASFGVIGMGTDNCASLTIPAAYNGLTTLRPTRGLLSMSGIYPSNYLDAAPGPLARSSRDLAIALDVLNAKDPDDVRTKHHNRDRSFTQALSPDALQGKRIGILRRYGGTFGQDFQTFSFDPAGVTGQKIFRDSITRLQTLGATIVENVALPDLNTDRTSAGGSDEVNQFFNRWVAQSPASSFSQMCHTKRYSKFTYSSKEDCLDRDRWGREIGFIGSHHHKNGENRYNHNHAYLKGVMDRLRLDALLLPADGIGAPSTNYYSQTHCVITSVTGAPAVVFLGGYDNGLPVGMMLIGRRGQDVDLVSFAHTFEQSLQIRTPPTLPNTPQDNAPIDFRRLNDLRLRIGEASWQQVLKSGQKFDLSAQTFREIVAAEKETHSP